MAQIHRENGGYLGIDVREPVDPWFDSVVLLLQPDAGDTTIVDKSPLSLPLTVNNATLNFTNQFWNGAPSIDIDNNDTITIPARSEHIFGAFDFSILVKCELEDVSSTNTIVARDDGTSRSFSFNVTNGNLEFVYFANDSQFTVTGSTTLSTGTKYNFAVTQQSNVFKLFVDGVLDGSGTTTSAIDPDSTELTVGSSGSGGNNFVGVLTSLKITRGVAHYISNFTPQARPFPTRRYASGVFQP